MKTKPIKTAIYIGLGLLLLSPENYFGQNKQYLTTVADNIQKNVTSFSAKSCEGKVYLNWTTHCIKYDGIYIIERSTDNKNFSLIGLKAGTGCDLNIDLLHCWTDKNAPEGNVYYRLQWVQNKNEISPEKNIPGTNMQALVGLNK